MTALIHHISDLLNEEVKSYKPLSGGDISQAFLIKTAHHRYFLKVNSGVHALHMFNAEQLGLETLANSKAILAPTVFHSGIVQDRAFLLMEYIEPKPATSSDLERFGHQLAALHKTTAAQFGFEHSNFIGSLSQCNTMHSNWLDFYVEERLVPQFNLALSKNLMSNNEIPAKRLIKIALSKLFKGITPRLLHGDLWNGNFLISTNGTPYVIDPAVYYGHHEVDIAMTKLFGGFSSSFYNAYHEIFPLESNTSSRTEIYQLYYLLVHLNLFGSTYYNAVKQLIKKYF